MLGMLGGQGAANSTGPNCASERNQSQTAKHSNKDVTLEQTFMVGCSPIAVLVAYLVSATREEGYPYRVFSQNY